MATESRAHRRPDRIDGTPDHVAVAVEAFAGRPRFSHEQWLQMTSRQHGTGILNKAIARGFVRRQEGTEKYVLTDKKVPPQPETGRWRFGELLAALPIPMPTWEVRETIVSICEDE